MPFINLIAEQRKSMRHRARRTRVWILTFFTICAAGVGGFGGLFIHAESLQAELRSLEAQGTELKPLRQAIEENEEQLASLAPRLETLGAARLDTKRWNRILDHVSLVLPNETWLTNVVATEPSDPAKPVEIAWTGLSAEQNFVGEFMLRMQRSVDLGNVQLKYTELKRTGEGVGLEFQIVSEVTGTATTIESDKKKETVKS